MRRTSQLALVILHVSGFTLACAGPELDSSEAVAVEDSAPPLLPEAPECPSWAGLAQAGATREWEFQACSDEATGGWTSRITGVTVNDGWRSVTVREEGAEGRETTSYSKTWVANLEYRCDDEGLWLIGSEVSATYSASGAPSYTSKHTLVLDAPALLLPSSLSLDTTWNTQATGVDESGMNEYPVEWEWTNVAVSEGEATIGEDNLPTLEISSPDRPDSESWAVSEGVGLVRDGCTVLVAFEE